MLQCSYRAESRQANRQLLAVLYRAATFGGKHKLHEEVVLIPAYMPDEALVDIVKALTKQGLSVLVVDDGSGEQYSHIFDKIRPMAQVVANPKNLGKGAALKRGMSELLLLYPECARVITADADGQHRTSDILRVREALRGGADFVLTVRDLSGDIPALSRIGNDLSRFYHFNYSLNSQVFICYH